MKKKKLIPGEYLIRKPGTFEFSKPACLSKAPLDDVCFDFESTAERLEAIRKELLWRVTHGGFRPPDAPKTKMLAGKFYEVLASRATRTDVDQKRVWGIRRRLHARKQGPAIYRFFETETIHSLREDWERGLTIPTRGFSTSRLRDLVTSCLSTRSSRRLTVRKRKLAKLAKSAKPQNRRAA